MAFRFVEFQPVAQTSTRPGSLYEHQSSAQMNYYVDRLGLFSWESHPYVKFPQDLVLKLEFRTEVTHVLMQADQEKEVNGLQIYIGDQVSLEDDTVSEIQFRLAGQATKVTSGEPVKIELFGLGTHLRFVFKKPDSRSGQVSLKGIKIWGQ